MAQHRRAGRPPKGDRKPVTVRLPATHYEAYDQAARAHGLTLNDYLTVVLAHGHELPLPDYVPTAGPPRESQPNLLMAS